MNVDLLFLRPLIMPFSKPSIDVVLFNQMEGTLPTELGNLGNLTELMVVSQMLESISSLK